MAGKLVLTSAIVLQMGAIVWSGLSVSLSGATQQERMGTKMKCSSYLVAISIHASLLTTSSIALADFPAFEDRTLGETFAVGDIFVTEGVTCKVSEFHLPVGPPVIDGSADIDDALFAAGAGYEIHTNNINITYDFGGSIGPQTDLTFNFGEYGGGINVAVNGDLKLAANYIDLDGMMIGGVLFDVLSGGTGGDAGAVRLVGVTDSLMIGGQENWNDQPICQPTFDDRPLGETKHSGDFFVTDGIDVYVKNFISMSGIPATGGYSEIMNGNLACGTDQELWTSVINVNFDFLNSVGTVENLYYRYGRYGGTINIEINGDFANVPDYSHLDGMVLGGVQIEVLSGGGAIGCGEVQLHGPVDFLLVGGEEFVVDCFQYELSADEPIAGDANADGCVDAQDFSTLLIEWGSQCGRCRTDFNNDGQVEAGDFSILLINFGNGCLP